MTWTFKEEVFDPTDEFLEPYQGFVYELEELSTGKKYIGKKFFWSVRKLPLSKVKKDVEPRRHNPIGETTTVPQKR